MASHGIINNACRCDHGSKVDKAVDDLMTYHPWDGEQIGKGARLGRVLAYAIKTIINCCPPSRSRQKAIENIIDARMHANAAITFKGRF